MRSTDEKNCYRVILAAVAASLVMLGAGLSHRVMAVKLGAPSDRPPIDPDLLSQFPMQVGPWQGQDVILDEEIVRATDTDAHLNRRYVRQDSLEAVTFYVACGIQARDLMPHRPEVCYVGNGWTLTDKRSLDVPLDGAQTLPCNVMQFARGGLVEHKLMVLDYYLVDGEHCRDMSLLRSRAWRGSGTVEYAMQVQVVTGVKSLRGEAETARLSKFAGITATLLARIIEDPNR